MFKVGWMVSLAGAGVTGAHWAYRSFNFNVPVYDVPADLKKHTFVITGADSGIGEATVKALAPSGARIIMACKDVDQCKVVRRAIVISSKNRQVVCRKCDLSSFESVKKFAAKIIKEEPKIDVLINNAGVKYVNPRRTTRDSIERQLGVNFLGHHLLTMLLLDKMKESGTSRIVNVTGKSFTKGKIDFDDFNSETNYSPSKAYDQSKLAVVLATRELANELSSSASGVTVNCVDPGYVNTKIERYTDAYFTLIRNAVYWLTRREPRQGAFPLLYSALSLEMQGVTGKFVTSKLTQEEFDANCSEDPIVRRKLFLTADKWTRLAAAKDEVKQMVENSSYAQEREPHGSKNFEVSSKLPDANVGTMPNDAASIQNSTAQPSAC